MPTNYNPNIKRVVSTNLFHVVFGSCHRVVSEIAGFTQTQESTSECTPSGPTQSAPPYMIEYDINARVKGQCRGHMKGVGRQLTCMASQAGASSAAAGSSTSVPGPTSAQPTTIPKLVHQQVTEML